jgi:DNA-binding NarL/FixJ family response regulator
MNGAAEAPLRVLIADDHPLILSGIRRALDLSEDVEVVGEAHSGTELFALVERRSPELVLVDLRMPDVEGVSHIQELRRRWPQLKIVILSGSAEGTDVEDAMRAGASAFLIKSVKPSDIPALLRQVAGGALLHPTTSPATEAGGARVDLTERERDILAAVAEGRTTAEVSRELFISEHTVKFHLSKLYRKLGVSNRAGAVRWALQHHVNDG